VIRTYNWGVPTDAPGVYALGGAGWEITWSPEHVHPYAAYWLELSTRYGPPGRMAPPQDLWHFTLQTKDLAD
jgi:hypothetical protein